MSTPVNHLPIKTPLLTDPPCLNARLLDNEAIEALHDPSVFQSCEFAQGKLGYRFMPNSSAILSDVLALATERKQSLALSLESVLLQKEPVFLNLAPLKRKRKYSPGDLTITVESGMTFGELQKILKEEHQFFPLTYPDETTLLEIFSEDRPSLEAGLTGYPRDFVLGLEIVTPDGRVTRSGAEVVKNVTGYDTNKLYVGSRNTLGIITALTLKVLANPIDKRKNPQTALLIYDSLAQALLGLASLSGRTTQQSLMLNRCELLAKQTSHNTQWHLLIGSLAEPELEILLGEVPTRAQSIQYLKDDLEMGVVSDLMQWPKEAISPTALWVEWAMPKAILPAFMQQVLPLFGEHPPMRFQTRPQAGLVYAVWEGLAELASDQKEIQQLNPQSFSPKSTQLFNVLLQIEALMMKLQKERKLEPICCDGTRILQAPFAYENIIDRFNTAKDPILRQLNHKLKTLYDPACILLNRYCTF